MFVCLDLKFSLLKSLLEIFILKWVLKKSRHLFLLKITNLNKKERQILERFSLSTFRATVNPIEAGRSESMYSLGGGVPRPTSLEKGIRELGMGLKCIFIDQFFKKIRPITFNSLGAKEG